MKKAFDPHRLDVRRFAEEGGRLGGEDPVAGFPRLQAEAQDRTAKAPVTWTAQGEIRSSGHQDQSWIHLEADAALPLICQRCLSEVDMKLHVDRWFRFARDEETAAAEDDESEEDVLAESRAFNLVELVEDELLMEVPVAPMHVICPVLPQFSAADEGFDSAEAARPNPFAVLQSLKPKG